MKEVSGRNAGFILLDKTATKEDSEDQGVNMLSGFSKKPTLPRFLTNRDLSTQSPCLPPSNRDFRVGGERNAAGQNQQLERDV